MEAYIYHMVLKSRRIKTLNIGPHYVDEFYKFKNSFQIDSNFCKKIDLIWGILIIADYRPLGYRLLCCGSMYSPGSRHQGKKLLYVNPF